LRPREKHRDEIVRKFWTVFLGVQPDKSGNVPGFRQAWNAMSEWAQRRADNYCYWTTVKIGRDGRAEDECISAGVAALRAELKWEPPAQKRSHPEYAKFRFEIINRILTEHLKPVDVAKLLEDNLDRFPFLVQPGVRSVYHECVRYRQMGDKWESWESPRHGG